MKNYKTMQIVINVTIPADITKDEALAAIGRAKTIGGFKVDGGLQDYGLLNKRAK